MRYGRYGLPYMTLRIGLAVTFLWIGFDILKHPGLWIGYLPPQQIIDLPPATILRFIGLFDISLGLMFLSRATSRLAGLLASIHLIGILITNGIAAGLIRNLGLIGATLAIALWPSYHRAKKHWWNIISRRKRREEFEEYS